MSVSNIHPELLARLESGLPDGAKITKAMTYDDKQSMILINYAGAEHETLMQKQNITPLFINRDVSIEAKEGELLSDVIGRISDKYKMFLLKSVDYINSSETVKFNDVNEIQNTLAILPDSISWYGNITYVIKNMETLPEYPKSVGIELPLNYERIELALCSKVFAIKGSSFSGNQLSSGFCDVIIEHMKSCQIPLDEDAKEELGLGVIKSFLDDGVSKLVTVVIRSGIPYIIRCNPVDTPVLG